MPVRSVKEMAILFNISYFKESILTPSWVILTGLINPCSSKNISSMQVTRWLRSDRYGHPELGAFKLYIPIRADDVMFVRLVLVKDDPFR